MPKMSHGHRCWLVLIRRKHADIVLNGVSCAEIHGCREQGGSSCRRFAHGISFVSRALDRGPFGGIERFVAGGLPGQPICWSLKLVRIILSGWRFGMMLIFGYLL